MKPPVAIVDYKMGNVFGLSRACEYLGLAPVLTADPEVIAKSQRVILPGVGAFGDAMLNIRKAGLDRALERAMKDGKRIVGICLGMQLLFREGHEFGRHQGLGFIPGEVLPLPRQCKDGRPVRIPHLGWTTVMPASAQTWKKAGFCAWERGVDMYFAHSYYAAPEDTSCVLGLSCYEGHEYASAVIHDNIRGLQFHPERSAGDGLAMLKASLF